MKVSFVTGNEHKFEEMRSIMKEKGIDSERIDYDYPEVQSDELEIIASEGARHSREVLGRAIVVEDSGLFINALNGFPGPYSSYVQQKIGNEGILKVMIGIKDRSAFFKSVVAFCEPKRAPVLFKGVVHGRIIEEIRGENGFGYDPIFAPNDKTKTFGEMEMEEKNEISHRRKAFESFIDWLED
jgi:XTP/dITP diphosphohydrolase